MKWQEFNVHIKLFNSKIGEKKKHQKIAKIAKAALFNSEDVFQTLACLPRTLIQIQR